MFSAATIIQLSAEEMNTVFRRLAIPAVKSAVR